ncbi:MAG: hypothetical protein AAF570_10010, partial [Bacteroidota bacterium]
AMYLDFVKNSVRLLPAIMLWVSGWSFQLARTGSATWESMGLNTGFVLLMLLVATVALRARNGQKLVNGAIGFGDVAMFFGVAAWLDAPGFAMYFVVALVLILVGLLALNKGKAGTARFAGILAGMLLVAAPLYWAYQVEIRLWLEAFE